MQLLTAQLHAIVFGLVFLCGLALGTAAHEAGHAIAAWLARIPLRLVNVGLGPVLVRVRLGQTWLTLRSWPFSGFVVHVPRRYRPRRQYAPMILGGVLGNVILGAAAAAASAARIVPDVIAEPVGLAQVCMFAINLLPRTIRIGGMSVGSDGMQLIKTLFRRSTDWIAQPYAALMRGMGLPQDHAPSRDAPELLYEVARPDRVTDAWARREATQTMRRLLERGQLPEHERVNDDALLGRHGIDTAEAVVQRQARDVVAEVVDRVPHRREVGGDGRSWSELLTFGTFPKLT